MRATAFERVHAALDFEGRAYPDVAVRYKGNNTFQMARNSIKRSFKIQLNRYVKGRKLAGQTTINLHNNVTDASWMNEVLSYELFREAGVPAPRTSYARVFVSVPGLYERKYVGLYSIVEEIDKHFAADRFGTEAGAIFKPVTRELFGYLFAAGRAAVDRAELRQEALEHRQEPAVAAARLRAAGLNLSAVRRERYPWISYVQLAHQSRSTLPVVRWSFQVGVELPVFRLRSPAVRASSVRMLQAELENRAARAAVIAEVEEVLQRLDASARALAGEEDLQRLARRVEWLRMRQARLARLMEHRALQAGLEQALGRCAGESR